MLHISTLSVHISTFSLLYIRILTQWQCTFFLRVLIMHDYFCFLCLFVFLWTVTGFPLLLLQLLRYFMTVSAVVLNVHTCFTHVYLPQFHHCIHTWASKSLPILCLMPHLFLFFLNHTLVFGLSLCWASSKLSWGFHTAVNPGLMSFLNPMSIKPSATRGLRNSDFTTDKRCYEKWKPY